MHPITIAYTPEYLDWQLGSGHPTNPERARLALELIETQAQSSDLQVRTLVPTLDWDRLETRYLDALGTTPSAERHLASVRQGLSDEWHGRNERLGDVAGLMFLGTVDLVDRMERDAFAPAVYFNPQGAKRHAQIDRSSGFCVFNDMAWAARHLAGRGMRVAYLDWDAHHGDGVEVMCAADRRILTASIHDRTIFPGTRADSDPHRGVVNVPLDAGAGDEELLIGIDECLAQTDAWRPDVVLVACGADGLAGDPLSMLQYSLGGLEEAARRVGRMAAAKGVPVLIGGAGGYQPLTETPLAWARTVLAITEELGRSYA